MKLKIDGKEVTVRDGMTVLEAALESGIYIPHICKHPDLEAIGGCRLCVVEIDGKDDIMPSCKVKVEEGMNVLIHSEKAIITRKMALELILATHPADCTGCPKYGNCELQSIYQYLGVSPEGWKMKSRAVPNNTSNPLIDHSFTRCIRCGRCVRACQELRGVNVLDYRKRKDGIRIGTLNDMSLEDAGCRFCGACVEVCPTGAITDTINLKDEGFSQKEGIVPCRAACPSHTDVPRYIRYIKQGEYGKATAVIREKVPFPEVLGSICNHICEDHCKRTEFENPISICKLKKAASSRDDGMWKGKGFHMEPTGKKVAIVGSGPAGMTAAYFLAKKGHEVTVYEASERPGGQMSYGIPAYRLSNDIVEKEIQFILEEGVTLKTQHKVNNPQKLLKEGADAVLIATGSHEGIKIPIEGHDLKHVFVNTDFLRSVRENAPLNIKERVMILGGGNVAYDCARTCIRLGAKEVHIACLENESQMTASHEEIEEGKAEGILLHHSSSFLRITGIDHAEGVELQHVKSFKFSEGKAIIDLVEGSNHIIPVDSVIFAVGQRPKETQSMGLELYRGAYIKTNKSLLTSEAGIYAAGDVVTGTISVVEACAQGRTSAVSIDLYLGGDGDITEKLVDLETPQPWIGRIDNFTKLNRTTIELVTPELRKNTFNMVEKTLTPETATCEAERCLQCDLRLQINKPKLWNEFQGGV